MTSHASEIPAATDQPSASTSKTVRASSTVSKSNGVSLFSSVQSVTSVSPSIVTSAERTGYPTESCVTTVFRRVWIVAISVIITCIFVFSWDNGIKQFINRLIPATSGGLFSLVFGGYKGKNNTLRPAEQQRKEASALAAELSTDFAMKHRRPLWGSLRQSWTLDFKLWIPDSKNWISVFVTGTWIVDSNR